MASITSIPGSPLPVYTPAPAPAPVGSPGGVQVAATKPEPAAATAPPAGLGQVINLVA